MTPLVISNTSDVLVESVGSSFLRVILISSNSIEVLVAPEVRAAVVASPARVLELDTHSLSEVDPLESSPPPVSIAPMILPFLCFDDSESDTKIPERHVSPTNFTSEIPNAPILPAPSAIVAPPFEFPLPPVVAPPEIRRRQAILFQPEEDIPIGQLYRTHPGGPCKVLTTRKSVKPLPSHHLALRYTSHHLDRFTFGSSSSHSSSDHSLFGNSSSNHSLSKHTSPDTTDADSSTLQRFVHLPLNKTPRCSEAYFRWRDSISSEDSVEEDIDTDVLEDIEADATTIEVAVDRDVKGGIDVGIGMKVDVMIDVEDEVKDEVESSDRGTMEVGVDMDAGIDIPDEIPLQRIEDIETAQRQLEAGQLITSRERAGLSDKTRSLERENLKNMTITCFGITPEAIEKLVNRRVEEALAAYEATRAANVLKAENQS
nr:hypothetical protein [Tanacetum cinerariifolium]